MCDASSHGPDIQFSPSSSTTNTLAAPASCFSGENLPSAIVVVHGTSWPGRIVLSSLTASTCPSDSDIIASPKEIPEMTSLSCSSLDPAEASSEKLLNTNRTTINIAVNFPDMETDLDTFAFIFCTPSRFVLLPRLLCYRGE